MSAYRLYSCDHRRRFAVTLAHGRPDHDRYEVFDRQEMIRPFGPGLMNQMMFLGSSRRWLRLHHGEFDVFYGLWGYEVVTHPAAYAKRFGLPAAVRIAAHRVDLADKGGWKNLLGAPRRRRQAIARLDAIIAISQAIYQELLEYGVPEHKIAMIPNGVDIGRFRPAVDAEEKQAQRDLLGWPTCPVLLFVGAIEQRKRPHLLVEALVELKRQGGECHLVLAGPERDAAYCRSIRKAVRAAGLESRVEWRGMVQDVEGFYRAADFFSLPSAQEGMPNALLEAMSSGLPPIVTAISGTVDVVHEDCGQFVEPNVGSIADALSQYLDHPEVAATHGKNARKLIQEKHSAEVILTAHERLFRQIMA